MKILSKLLLLLLASQFTFAQSVVSKIETISQEIHKKNPEVAISIGFIENGKDHFFNYGTISKKSTQKVDKNTIYEIGSVTKVFTANLMVQAQNEGKLNTNDFIDTYLPKEYFLATSIKEKIKISDLASHQSGLPDLDFKQLLELNPKQPLDIDKEKIHAIFNENTQLIDYGMYRYSNINFILMGIILENVYNKNYETLVTEKILIPAKMNQTLTSKFSVKNKVVVHNTAGNEQDYLNWNPLVASAGLLKSNTTDITKFLHILLENEGEIGKTTAITETTFFKNTQREIGFGQQMERERDDVFFYKTGDTLGCSSIMAYDKKTNWGIVIFINHQNSKLCNQIFNMCYEKALQQKSLNN